MSDNTPSPQSVVVDTFNGDNAALVRSIAALLTMKNLTPPVPGLARQLLAMSAARLAASPAPSSLAGGEVMNDDAPTYMRLAQALSRHPEVMVVERSDPTLELTPDSLEHLLEDVFPLAALSPEAQAEGAGGLGSPSQWCDFLPEPSGPAEGAGAAWGWDREVCTGCSASLTFADIKARGCVSCCPERRMIKVRDLVDAYETALRARSSAPEAREGEAVGLDEAQRKAVERAAMDAGAYSWRNARLAMVEGQTIIGYPAFSRADMAELARLNNVTTILPAAPSADKLRIAAEAVRDSLKCEGPEHKLIYQRDRAALDRIATGSDLRRAIVQALAALKAEGAK